MKYKLIASDIDGTLFNSKGELTAETVQAVKDYLASGAYFVLSTGRPYQAIVKLSKDLGLSDMPYILYNGAMVQIGGETVYSLTLDKDAVRTIADEGRKRNSTMLCWADNKLYSEADNEKVRFYKAISGVEPIIVDDLGTLGGNVTKFVWYDTPELTARYFGELKNKLDGVNVHPSRVDFLEFVSKSCSKAVAMQVIGDKLNITEEEMVAVGDGFNDLPMLVYAGLGVAVENAAEDVKKECDLVVPSCDENGVAYLIRKLLAE